MLHDSLIVFDGHIISSWSEDIFRDIRRGGLTAANCTCCVWEGFTETMRNVARWNRWFGDLEELIVKAKTVEDTRRTKADNRTAIVLGFQNDSAFEDQIGAVSLSRGPGVRHCADGLQHTGPWRRPPREKRRGPIRFRP